MDLVNKNMKTVLIRLHKEAHEPDIPMSEYARRGFAIKYLLDMYETDFGTHEMLKIFTSTSEKLGETLGPLVEVGRECFQNKGYKRHCI